MIKKYEIYISQIFLKYFIFISLIFLFLIFFVNILEELKFFSNLNLGLSYPVLLTLLNIPSLMFEIFPFIFLITSQFFFLNLYDTEEILILKNNGITNFKIVKIILFLSLLIGLFIITLFYTFSANLKHSYLNFKNKFTNDNKYLAVINENGLWLKEEINEQINIINGEYLTKSQISDVTIAQLGADFDLQRTIVAKTANIQDFIWVLKDVQIFKENNPNITQDEMLFQSSFNTEKINNIFSNLSSRNIIQLNSLIKDYKKLGYSTLEIKSYLYKLYSYPIFLIVMTTIGAVLMLNVKYNKSKTINLILGILLSVMIYYIYYFSNLLGIKEKIPVLVSVVLPHIILVLICTTGMVKINEK